MQYWTQYFAIIHIEFHKIRLPVTSTFIYLRKDIDKSIKSAYRQPQQCSFQLG